MTAVATTSAIRIDDVVIGERARKDYGDLTDLMESIRKYGVLEPVGLNEAGELLFGGRRIEASRRLGLEAVPFLRLSHLTDAVSQLEAERDDNTCRKEMTPSEKVQLGLRLEELERPAAEARRLDGNRLGAAITNAQMSDDIQADDQRPRSQVNEVVAPAVGLSPSKYARAKSIVIAATDSDETPEIQEAAKQLVHDMDSEKKTVNRAYEDLTSLRKGTVKAKAVAPSSPKFGRRRKHVEVLTNAATSLSGLLIVVGEIGELDASVGNEEAARLRGGFSEAITGLNRINKLLKERIA